MNKLVLVRKGEKSDTTIYSTAYQLSDDQIINELNELGENIRHPKLLKKEFVFDEESRFIRMDIFIPPKYTDCIVTPESLSKEQREYHERVQQKIQQFKKEGLTPDEMINKVIESDDLNYCI